MQFVPPELENEMFDFTGRQWVLERIRRWLVEDNARFFLLTGDIGAGKTALGAWLMGAGPAPMEASHRQRLNEIRESWSAGYFCSSRLISSSLDPRDFSRSISRQLIDNVEGFERFIVRSLEHNISSHVDVSSNFGTVRGINIEVLMAAGLTSADTYAVSVREPLIAFLERYPNRRVAILVDGLDEAAMFPPINIPGLLANSAGFPTNFRLLLVTRNDQRVIADLRDHLPEDIQHLDLSNRSLRDLNDDDIRQYLSRKISQGGYATIVGKHGSATTVKDLILKQTEGNFLYARGVLEDLRNNGAGGDSLRGIPGNLGDMYTAILSRLTRENAFFSPRSEDWPSIYKPLFGCLSVAFSPVPEEVLAEWIGIDLVDLRSAATSISQLVAYNQESGSYSLNHGALQRFFLTGLSVNGRPNRFAVNEIHQHQFIVLFYEQQIADNGWRAVDDYGLIYLTAHFCRLVVLMDALEERSYGYRDRLARILKAEEFMNEILARVRDPALRSQPFRIALNMLLAKGSYDLCDKLIMYLGGSPDIFVRNAAMESVRTYFRYSPKRADVTLKALLISDDPTIWLTALRVATGLDADHSEKIFSWVLANASPGVRDAAPYALYLNWAPLPRGHIDSLLHSMARNTSLVRPRLALRRLEFISNVTITNFISRGDGAELMPQISTLWEFILVKRFRMRMLNRPLIERLILSPTLARHLARRVLDAVMVPELQNPGRFFQESQNTADLIRLTIPHLDPQNIPTSSGSTILALLKSDLIICRVLAIQVIAIHCMVNFGEVEPWLQELFDLGNGRSRIWQILAFGVLANDAPPEWLPVIERFTERLLLENRDSFDDYDSGLLVDFDAILVPVGMAYGRMGLRPTLLEQVLTSSDTQLRKRVLHSTGILGLYYPYVSIEILSRALLEGLLEDSMLVDSLSMFYTLHPQAVEIFLGRYSRRELLHQIAATADYDRIRLSLDRIGHFNNGINEAVRWPRMRTGLLEPVYRILIESHTSREFVRSYVNEVMAMLRDVNYKMIEWVEP